MSSVIEAAERLNWSRARLRQALNESAAVPNRSNSPMHLAGKLANDAINRAVRPFARRNPFGLVLGAALTGALLAWSRPWRWLLSPALVATLLPQLLSKALGQAPPLSLLKILTMLTRASDKPDRPTR